MPCFVNFDNWQRVKKYLIIHNHSLNNRLRCNTLFTKCVFSNLTSRSFKGLIQTMNSVQVPNLPCSKNACVIGLILEAVSIVWINPLFSTWWKYCCGHFWRLTLISVFCNRVVSHFRENVISIGILSGPQQGHHFNPLLLGNECPAHRLCSNADNFRCCMRLKRPITFLHNGKGHWQNLLGKHTTFQYLQPNSCRLYTVWT